MPHPIVHRWGLSALCFVGLLSACAAEPPEPAIRTEAQTVTAKVLSVDKQERLLTVEGPHNVVTIEVPESVEGLDRVNAGDQISVTYYEGLAAVFASKTQDDETADGVHAQGVVAKAPPGAPPGRAVGRTVTARVTIQSVDKEFNTVTFTGPRGLTRVVGVNDPKMQEFAARLKPGDQVDLTYFEALAARVVPVR